MKKEGWEKIAPLHFMAKLIRDLRSGLIGGIIVSAVLDVALPNLLLHAVAVVVIHMIVIWFSSYVNELIEREINKESK